MCLTYVKKRSVMAEGGTAWKEFYQLPEEDEFYTTVREVRILPDVWLLNQDPSKKCGCGVRHLKGLEGVRYRYRSLSYDTMTVRTQSNGWFVPAFSQALSQLTQAPTPEPNTYEHGFHLWKKEEQRPDLQSREGWVVEAIKAGELRIINKLVFWRGYIAEDDTQIVTRQIYVPHKTSSPEEGARIWEVTKQDFVEV